LVLDAEFRAPFVNVNRYFKTMVNQSEFKAVIGDVAFCEKMAVFDPTNIPKPSQQPQQHQPKEHHHQEKQPHQPKEQKPKEEKEKEETFEEPKTANPLDSLPPSKFNLENWKRFYSNNDEATAIKFFWENIDLEGFSLWYCSYKEKELKQKIFMTCNLVGGFFQRLEEVRKYAFGSFCVFGEDGSNELHGVWVFRGQEIPNEVKECPDFESYDFSKITEVNDETKLNINAFLAWQEIDGSAKFSISSRPFNQGKNYK